MELERTTWWVISADVPRGVIRLTWLSANAPVPDRDFMAALERLGDLAAERASTELLEDLRALGRQLSPDLGRWIDEELVPRYQRQCIAKWAFVTGSEPSANQSIVNGTPARRFFATEAAAKTWLARTRRGRGKAWRSTHSSS